MSTSPTFAPIQTSPRKPTRQRALKDIHYNTISSIDVVTSSEDETPEAHAIAPSDAQSIVGVSIGRAQTRLNAPETASAEKAAALDETAGGFFGDAQIHEDAELDGEDETGEFVKSKETIPLEEPRQDRVSRRDTQGTPPGRLPSPWRAGPKQFSKTDRGASGAGSHTLETWRNHFMSNLPSMPSLPMNFTFNSPFSFGHGHNGESNGPPDGRKPGGPAEGRKRSGSMFHSPNRGHSNDSVPRLAIRPPTAQSTGNNTESMTAVSRHPERTVSRQLSRTQSGLRRSASDTSLQTFRTGNSLSRVPSLGDDSRFENIQGQVNSRLKAIKDSWQDSNFNLPFAPKVPNLSSISSINLSSTLPRRTNSFNKKSVPATYREGQRNRSPIVSPSVPSTPKESEIRQITQNSKSSAGNFAAKSAAAHPHFTKALHELTGDVVVLGGYRGSILRLADPPHRQVWVPIKVGLNIRKVDLEVGLGPEADRTMEERIIPGGMLSHVGPVDISRRLFKRLRGSDNAQAGRLRVHDYGYDWRLEPNYLSQRMIKFLEKLPCNQPGVSPDKRGATVIAHSLGGLITRHAVNQRPDLFAGVVYAGVPHTCVNILGPFRNGDEVLLSSRVLTAQVNFTIRTSFALLPLDGRCFFNKQTKEEYPVDFFDPQTWIDYRLSPCIARPLPPLDQPQPTGFAGIMSSMASVLPSRKGSITSRTRQAVEHPGANAIGGLAQPPGMKASAGNKTAAEAQNNIDYEGTDNLRPAQVDGASMSQPDLAPAGSRGNQPTSVGTTVTLPREACLKYLTRILADIKRFKQETSFNSAHNDANAYPPAAVIYGKTTPTVFGAKVASREAIKHADAYDELAFASGDGVVLARAAMLPEGYPVAKGGVVSSDRGHVTLLGDLEAVGKCLRAVMIARRKGVGKGHRE